jgi:hypothetical protein
MSKHLYSLPSDRIPVSICPGDDDEDFINNNVGRFDNDGITNCTESYGNQNIDILNAALGTIAVGTYSNSFHWKRHHLGQVPQEPW